MANDVRFLTEVLELAPTHVVGHSLGGGLAKRSPSDGLISSEKSFLCRPPPRYANVGGGCGKTSVLCDPIDPKALSFGNGLLAQFR